MPFDTYTIEIEVTGEQPVWYDKRKNRFGSDDYYVNVEKILISVYKFIWGWGYVLQILLY